MRPSDHKRLCWARGHHAPIHSDDFSCSDSSDSQQTVPIITQPEPLQIPAEQQQNVATRDRPEEPANSLHELASRGKGCVGFVRAPCIVADPDKNQRNPLLTHDFLPVAFFVLIFGFELVVGVRTPIIHVVSSS